MASSRTTETSRNRGGWFCRSCRNTYWLTGAKMIVLRTLSIPQKCLSLTGVYELLRTDFKVEWWEELQISSTSSCRTFTLKAMRYTPNGKGGLLTPASFGETGVVLSVENERQGSWSPTLG